MTKTRLEAFSDAVIAIIMTIMVLELRPPDGASWHAFREEGGKFGIYALSFVFLAIYWNNHHHLLQASERVNGKILWANMHLLFWLSLTPFATAWMGDQFHETPVATYGIVLLLAAIAYYILQGQILAAHGPSDRLSTALAHDVKGKVSPLLYALAIGAAYVQRWISIGLYILVALMWLVPDRRIESTYQEAVSD
ncbi:MAG: TMEM175 family protein [Actinomycetota bacterium]